MSDENLEPQKHTGFLLRTAQQAHVAAWQEVINDSDVTNIQYGILSVLSRRPGVSQKEICEELLLDRSTVGDVCVRMEKNGLLSRVADENDRRRNVLELTPAGAAEYARLVPLVVEVQKKLTSKLTATEVQQLRALLVKLRD